ncbi:MAG: YhfC family glutamic-type intramembrane protease [Sandaracinaceae bacterium]
MIFGFTIGLAVWLRRKTRVGYALLGAGALVFVASQVVHLPLNWALGQVLPNEHGLLWVTAIAVGLSAGLCEELARWVAIEWITRRVRDTEHALMLGMGHGGVEALIVGAMAGLIFNLSSPTGRATRSSQLSPRSSSRRRRTSSSSARCPRWSSARRARKDARRALPPRRRR